MRVSGQVVSGQLLESLSSAHIFGPLFLVLGLSVLSSSTVLSILASFISLFGRFLSSDLDPLVCQGLEFIGEHFLDRAGKVVPRAVRVALGWPVKKSAAAQNEFVFREELSVLQDRDVHFFGGCLD